MHPLAGLSHNCSPAQSTFLFNSSKETIMATILRRKDASPTSYFLVPPLKALVSHKIISLIYEDDVPIHLGGLNHDVLEYLFGKMPFAVMFRVYELKLCEEFCTKEYIQNYVYLSNDKYFIGVQNIL